MKLYRGVIEDNLDPNKLGRVRVRIYGIHSEDKSFVKTTELPWSEVIEDNNFSGSGLGWSSVPYIGTVVWIVLDHDNPNSSIVIGAVSGISDKDSNPNLGFNDPSGTLPLSDRLNESDINRLVRGESLDSTIHNSINNSLKSTTAVGRSIQEPSSTNDSTLYPNNRVFEDKSGNIIEIDATPSNSRIRVYHSSGARIEFDKDGNIIVKGLNNSYNLISGDLSEYIEKNVQSKINGLLSIEAGAITLKGDLKVTGSVECTGAIAASGNIVSSGDVADKKGNLDSLRSAYDGHNHLYQVPVHPAGEAPTAIPTTTDPLSRASEFKWSGSPL